MKISISERQPRDVRAPLHVTAVFSDKKAIPADVPANARVDFDGKPRSFVMAYGDGDGYQRMGLVGLGDKDAVELEWVRRASAVVANRARAMEFTAYCLDLRAVLEVLDPEDVGRVAAEGACLANYSFTSQKGSGESKTKSGGKQAGIKTVTFLGSGAAFKRGVKEGLVGAVGACFARDLGNTPGNHMTPTQMAAEARKLAQGKANITCKVLEEAEMKKLGMGSLLSVSRGSAEPAKLVHLKYSPSSKARKKRIALVGKGLTFDTGGISIKPSRGMEEMKFDMCGGAAVLGVFRALRELSFPHEVHGVVACAENMPGSKATKPGDVVTAMNGTTIEVLNTDAEGRLVLADALCYVQSKIKPTSIVDLATLTGAVIVALGHEFTGVMGHDDLVREIVEAGEATGERGWPLPLMDVHKDQMKSETADLRNINSPADGNGSTAGGAFLAHFVEDAIPWAHLDIAGTAWGGRNRDYYTGKGASGVGVRMLLHWLRSTKI